MGTLIEQQAVIDCLTNTAKYYEREDGDEWTKGIHYGLLHGVDNILDDVPTVEAIPKADYETRLRADMVATLEELDLQIDELKVDEEIYRNFNVKYGIHLEKDLIKKLIKEKINALKETNK